MTIRKIDPSDKQSLIDFNKTAFPERDQVEESIKYRLIDNPNAKNGENETLVAENKDQKIVGQMMLMPAKFSYDGMEFPAFWGMDYFVDDLFRGTPAGTILCKKALKSKYHFGLGLSDMSLRIHLAFGEKVIGQLSTYIKLKNPFFYFNKFRKKKFSAPHLIRSKKRSFERVTDPAEIKSNKGYWNKHILEFTRDPEFIAWRYFHYPDKYFVYKLCSEENEIEELSTYFVVRPIVWKNINCLLLLDYRFPVNRPNMFTAILNAAHKVTGMLKLTATITGCSLPTYGKLLKKNFFFRFGSRMDLVTNFKLPEEVTLDTDKVMVTFADSDCDLYYANNKW